MKLLLSDCFLFLWSGGHDGQFDAPAPCAAPSFLGGASAAGAALLGALLASLVLFALRLLRREPRRRRPTVVVIGAGFAGLQVAMDLQRRARVVLLDRATHFEFTPALLRALCSPPGADPLANRRIALQRAAAAAEVVTLPWDAALDFATAPGTLRVVPSPGVAGADAAGEQSFSYDYLVIATGYSYGDAAELPIKGTKPQHSVRVARRPPPRPG